MNYADALQEVHRWERGELRLQHPTGTVLHQLLEAWKTGKLIVLTPEEEIKYLGRVVDPTFDWAQRNRELLQHHFQTFLIEHNWGLAFQNSNLLLRGFETKPPYDHCCFEFLISGKRLCLIVHLKETSTSVAAFVRLTSGEWLGVLSPNDSPTRPLVQFTAVQLSAIMIALDAAVATTTIVRASESLNRAREKRGKLPLFDYHVVQLAHRTRPANLPPEHESERNSPRLHFRRGHWRHFETFKTWVNWMLVGDPDLGFIDKHYRL